MLGLKLFADAVPSQIKAFVFDINCNLSMFVCKDTFYISSTSQVSLPKKVQFYRIYYSIICCCITVLYNSNVNHITPMMDKHFLENARIHASPRTCKTSFRV